MISPITDFPLIIAENPAAEKTPLWAWVIIIAVFFLSSAAAGLITYRIKIKQFTEKENSENNDADE